MDILKFSKRVRERRKAAKMTQQQLADRLLVGIVTINQWENAKRTPERKRLIELAEELGCSVYYLTGETDEVGVPGDYSGRDKDVEERDLSSSLNAYQETFLKYIRLSDSSKEIVDAALEAAFASDARRKTLYPEGIIEVCVSPHKKNSDSGQ